MLLVNGKKLIIFANLYTVNLFCVFVAMISFEFFQFHFTMVIVCLTNCSTYPFCFTNSIPFI